MSAVTVKLNEQERHTLELVLAQERKKDARVTVSSLFRNWLRGAVVVVSPAPVSAPTPRTHISYLERMMIKRPPNPPPALEYIFDLIDLADSEGTKFDSSKLPETYKKVWKDFLDTQTPQDTLAKIKAQQALPKG